MPRPGTRYAFQGTAPGSGVAPALPSVTGKEPTGRAPVNREVARASPAVAPLGPASRSPRGQGPRGRSSLTCRLQLRDHRRVPESRLGELPVFKELVALALQAGGADWGGGRRRRRRARSGGRAGTRGRAGRRAPRAPPAARVPIRAARRRRGPRPVPLVRADLRRPAPPRRAPLRPPAALALASQLLLDVAHGARLGGAPGRRRLRGLCGEWMREVSVCIIASNYQGGRGGAGAGAGSREKPGRVGPPLGRNPAIPAPLGGRLAQRVNSGGRAPSPSGFPG